MPRTEETHPKAPGLDLLAHRDLLFLLHSSHMEAAGAVEQALEPLAAGAQAMASAVRNGRKLVYVAAGSSGLQGMADGLEITPTFGIPIAQIKILRAGGLADMARPKGDMEDNIKAAKEDADVIEPGDCTICLAASGTTTYPLTIMKAAADRGATTIGIANNPDTPLLELADIPILLPTPPEVIAGSTRLGAGTAQKIALNMMSSLMGVLLGHVMDGMMVNVIANNEKLFTRSENIVMRIAGCDRDTASANLRAAKGSVKVAILLAKGARDVREATSLLDDADQNLRKAIENLSAAG